MMRSRWLIVAFSFVLLTACSEDRSESETLPDNELSATEAPDTGEMMLDDRPATLRTDALGREIEQARNDLAERLQVDAAEIETTVAEFVTWSNGALGCPEPDMAYTQALVPGYRVMLIVNGQTYHYHGARDREPFYCPAERADQPRPASDLT